MVNNILAAGLWPALPLTGYALLRLCRITLPGSLRIPLVLVSVSWFVGLGLWSIPLVLTAGWGHYSGAAIGSFGWMVVPAALWAASKKPRLAASQVGMRFLPPENLALGVIMAMSGYLFLSTPAETIGGGRDEGVYANHAISIAHHGRLDIAYPWKDGEDSFFKKVAHPLPAFYPTSPTIQVRFAHVYPIWLAQAYSSFGFEGLIRFNGIIALFGMGIFYGVCRLFLPAVPSLGGVVIAAANPGQLWISHVTLSEPLAQAVIWVSLLFFIIALKNQDRFAAILAGAFASFSAFIRIDCFFLLPLFVLALAGVTVVNRGNIVQYYQTGFLFLTAAMAGILLAAAFYIDFCNIYLFTLRHEVRTIAVALIAAGLIFLCTLLERFRHYTRRILSVNNVQIGIGALFFLSLIFAYWIRPHLPPFAISISPSGTWGRDFRELSLVNVAQYLSLPIIFLASIGWYRCVRSVLREDIPELMSLVVISFGFGSLYLWQPSVSPDHFWAIRRFVPVVLPAVSFFSALGFNWITHTKPRWAQISLYGIFFLFIGLFFWNANALQRGNREYAGFYEQLERIANQLPSDATIFSDDGMPWGIWETPLFAAFDKNIIPVSLSSPGITQTVASYIRQHVRRNESIYFLVRGEAGLNGFQSESDNRYNLSRSYFEHTAYPLPATMAVEHFPLHLYKIRNVVRNYRDIPLGGCKTLGVQEDGFYDESKTGEPQRWTNGNAFLTIPVQWGEKPKSLICSFAVYNPTGSGATLTADGSVLTSGVFPPGEYRQSYSLDGVPMGDSLRVSFYSNTFVPALTMKNSNDERALGIIVRNVTITNRPAGSSAAALSSSGFRSSLRLEPSIQSEFSIPRGGRSVRLVIKNQGVDVWETPKELQGFMGAVRLGIIWHEGFQGGRVVGEQRAELPHAISPGDKVSLMVSLMPRGRDGSMLPAGKYDVEIGLLQEFIVWFKQKGDPVVSIPAIVGNK